MKKVVIYMEGVNENQNALSMAYAVERAINETSGIGGTVKVKSMGAFNLIQRMIQRRRMRVRRLKLKKEKRRPALLEVVR